VKIQTQSKALTGGWFSGGRPVVEDGLEVQAGVFLPWNLHLARNLNFK
jgi:hypothetical protein